MNATTQQPLVPSFQAYRSDRTLQPHIKRAFLRNLTIDAVHIAFGEIEHPDGSMWQIVLEPEAQKQILKASECQCLCSFQLWKDGSKWAVCKLAEDKRHGQ